MVSSNNIKRFLKKEYGTNKKQLPKTLEFIAKSNIDFYAIIEDEKTSRTVRTVELKPKVLKEIIDFIDELNSSITDKEKSIKKLRADKRAIKSENKIKTDNQEKYYSLKKETENLKDEMSEKEREIRKLQIQLQESGQKREKLEKKIEENASEISKKDKEIEDIKKVNETLLKNIESGPKDNLKKNETAMCDENKTSTILNANPLPGGKSKFKN